MGSVHGMCASCVCWGGHALQIHSEYVVYICIIKEPHMPQSRWMKLAMPLAATINNKFMGKSPIPFQVLKLMGKSPFHSGLLVIVVQWFYKFLQHLVATALTMWTNQRAEFKSCNLIEWHSSRSCNRMLQELGKPLHTAVCFPRSGSGCKSENRTIQSNCRKIWFLLSDWFTRLLLLQPDVARTWKTAVCM